MFVGGIILVCEFPEFKPPAKCKEIARILLGVGVYEFPVSGRRRPVLVYFGKVTFCLFHREKNGNSRKVYCIHPYLLLHIVLSANLHICHF